MQKTIILTIISGTILAFLIFKFVYHEDLYLTTLGDSISLGYTAYDVKGYSFNDYLRDEFEEQKHIKEYITEFSYPEETSTSLLLKLKNNYTLDSSELSITQAIAKSSILTIALGMHELNQKSNIDREDIETYLKNMEEILKLIRINNKKEIYLIGLYPTKKIKEYYALEINTRLNELAKYNQIIFIDIFNITKNNSFFFDNKSYLINYKGHKYIKDKIINKTQ